MKLILQYIHTGVEVVVFFYIFFFTMAQSSSNLMYQVKICFKELKDTLEKGDASFYNRIGNDTDNCFHLQEASYKDALEIVSKKQSNITAVALFLQMVPCAIACLIMVNAGHILGRKNLLVTALIGYFIYHVNFILNWYYLYESIWWMLMESWHEVLGGRPVMIVTCLMYVSDISSDETRSIRMNFIGMAEMVAMSLGTLASGQILGASFVKNKGPDGEDFYGFYVVFGIIYEHIHVNIYILIYV